MVKYFVGMLIAAVVLAMTLIIAFHHDTVGDGKLRIVCTTGMIADTVSCIAKEHASVHALMGPGVDPHLYKAREGDVHRLAQADLIFYNGLHLEGKMAHLLEQMNDYVHTAAVSKALSKEDLLDAGVEGLYDPHIWHDVVLWIKIARLVTQELIEVDPAHAQEYSINGQAYINDLEALDRWVRQQIATIPQEKRVLVTAHDAFSYFGASYGVEVVGLQGVSTDADVSTRDITTLVDFLIERSIHALFLESSIPARSIEAVHQAAQARGWGITLGSELLSDALGDADAGGNTYIDMIRSNVQAMVHSLR